MDIEAAKHRLSVILTAWKEADRSHSFQSLATRLGVSRESPRLWAAGKIFPRLEQLVLLCEDIGTAPAYVLFGIEEPMDGRVRVSVTNEEIELLKLFQALPIEQRPVAIRLISALIQGSNTPTNVFPIAAIPPKQ